ncbi:MAG: YraN family protein [Coraliomargaritaceae bacterium]
MKRIHRICEFIFYKLLRRLPEKSTRAQRGAFGEVIARSYCRRRLKYKIIAQNWRYKRYEIDLICREGDILVFIEVRARDEKSLISGYHSVNSKKKARLELACRAYMRQLSIPPKHFRFDIIEVQLLRNGKGEARHYQNIELFHKHYTLDNRTL